MSTIPPSACNYVIPQPAAAKIMTFDFFILSDTVQSSVPIGRPGKRW